MFFKSCYDYFSETGLWAPPKDMISKLEFEVQTTLLQRAFSRNTREIGSGVEADKRVHQNLHKPFFKISRCLTARIKYM